MKISAYLTLALVSFLSATILPFGSEPLFVGMAAYDFDPFPTIAIASIFNTLGGMTNYFLGKLGKTDWILKITKIKKEKFYKIQEYILKYGVWMALFTWLPWIGDPLAVLLGFMRADKRYVFLLMFLSKTLRYVFLWYVTKGVFSWFSF